MVKRIVIVSLVFSLYACSGGGSSTPPPVNQIPVFTSAPAVSVPENTSVAYQAVASDPEARAITYSLAGGADVALFDINSAGQVSFREAPSFETARDAGADNAYDVTVAASDGSTSSSQAIRITITNSGEGITVSQSGLLFDRPVAASAIVGSTDILIAERNGRIWRYNPVADTRSEYSTITAAASPDFNLLAILPRRDFVTSNQLTFAARVGNSITIASVRPLAPFAIDLGLINRLLSVTYPDTSHLSVSLSLDNMNVMHAAFGDAGGVNDPSGSAQGAGFLGKLVRFTPNPDPFGGVTPQPFIYDIVGRGIQNPRGLLSVDSNFLLVDRGGSRGEVNLYPQTAGGTFNYGWPFFEGTQGLATNPPAGLTPPALELAIGSGRNQGGTIVGGAILTDPGTSISGRYVFGDASGNIFAVRATALTLGSTLPASGFERRNEDFAVSGAPIGAIATIVSIGTGGLLIVSESGAVYRVSASLV